MLQVRARAWNNGSKSHHAEVAIRRKLLLHAESLARKLPERFWAPSADVLESARGGDLVKLRIMSVDDDGVGDLWDGSVLWVRLTSLSPYVWTGVIESSVETDGDFIEGADIEFDPSRVLAVWPRAQGKWPRRESRPIFPWTPALPARQDNHRRDNPPHLGR